MYLAIADQYEDPTELSRRRDRFTATRYSRSISPEGDSGTVVLEPDGRVLRVSGSRTDYERVRIFAADGRLVGMMSHNTNQTVQWVEPLRPV